MFANLYQSICLLKTCDLIPGARRNSECILFQQWMNLSYHDTKSLMFLVQQKEKKESITYTLERYKNVWNLRNVTKTGQRQSEVEVTAYVTEANPQLIQFSSVQFSHSVMSDSLGPHESQHARPPQSSVFKKRRSWHPVPSLRGK